MQGFDRGPDCTASFGLQWVSFETRKKATGSRQERVYRIFALAGNRLGRISARDTTINQYPVASPEIRYLLWSGPAAQISLPEFFPVQQIENVTDMP